MLDWLTAVIVGIVIVAVGYIVRYVFAEYTIARKLGYALVIIGAAIIVIGLILLAVMLIA